MKPENIEIVKQVGDGLSVVTVIGALVQVLPSVAALFTLVWTGMRITEMLVGKPFAEILRRRKDNDAEHQ
jgi:hypothetical protein